MRKQNIFIFMVWFIYKPYYENGILYYTHTHTQNEHCASHTSIIIWGLCEHFIEGWVFQIIKFTRRVGYNPLENIIKITL